MNNIQDIHHDSTSSIIFSSFLHALILFTILSALFILVISQLESKAFKNEINDNIQKYLPQALAQNDKDGSLKKVIKNLPIDNLKQIYSIPSAETSVYNSWLKKAMFIIIGAAIVVLIVSALFLYFTCGKKIPLWFIIIENLIIFLFVGIFEAVFFLKIASKYVPVPPSLLINTLYSDLKAW